MKQWADVICTISLSMHISSINYDASWSCLTSFGQKKYFEFQILFFYLNI